MMMMTTMTMTTMMTILMRLPLTVKILSMEISMKRGFNEGTLGTLRETLDNSEPNADNVISVQKNLKSMSFSHTKKPFKRFFFRLKIHRNFILGVLKCDALPVA